MLEVKNMSNFEDFKDFEQQFEMVGFSKQLKLPMNFTVEYAHNNKNLKCPRDIDHAQMINDKNHCQTQLKLDTMNHHVIYSEKQYLWMLHELINEAKKIYIKLNKYDNIETINKKWKNIYDTITFDFINNDQTATQTKYENCKHKLSFMRIYSFDEFA